LIPAPCTTAKRSSLGGIIEQPKYLNPFHSIKTQSTRVFLRPSRDVEVLRNADCYVCPVIDPSSPLSPFRKNTGVMPTISTVYVERLLSSMSFLPISKEKSQDED
jgi:hypothetical protein